MDKDFILKVVGDLYLRLILAEKTVEEQKGQFAAEKSELQKTLQEMTKDL